jgi:transcriptional regulator of acetoin/glycerol metabolism
MPAADRLLSYDWPGNLRELQRVIHTAVAITEGGDAASFTRK